jgi:hypothetical protein
VLKCFLNSARQYIGKKLMIELTRYRNRDSTDSIWGHHFNKKASAPKGGTASSRNGEVQASKGIFKRPKENLHKFFSSILSIWTRRGLAIKLANGSCVLSHFFTFFFVLITPQPSPPPQAGWSVGAVMAVGRFVLSQHGHEASDVTYNAASSF